MVRAMARPDRRLRHLAVACALVGAASCGGSEAPPKTARRAPPAVKTPAAPGGGAGGAPLLAAHVLPPIADENVTAYQARRGDGEGLVLVPSQGRWKTVRVGASGAPQGSPNDVAPAPAEVAIATVRAVGDGWLAAWLEPVGKNRAVYALELDAKGAARGAPILVTQLAEEVSWVDVLSNGKGSLVLWELPHGERSDLFVAPVGGGRATGAVAAVVRGALGWQAIATEGGAAIATVMPAPGATAAASDDASEKLGGIQLVEVDVTGKAAAPVVVTTGSTAQIDVEVVAQAGRYLLAWTDERDVDAAVFVAQVGGGKVVAPPKRATAPVGEQALVGLVAGNDGRALLAWEDLLKGPASDRLIHLGVIDAGGSLGTTRAAMTFAASGPPDVVADGDGFAAITLAPAARTDGGATPAARRKEPRPEATAPGATVEEPIWPTFVRFGPDLAVRAAEPVRAAPFAATDNVPYLTRALWCPKTGGGPCATLASGSGAGAALALVELPVRPSPWRAPARREEAEGLPSASAISALFDGEHLADVSAATMPDGTTSVVAWVTYFVDGAQGDATPKKKDKKGDDPFAATLALRFIPAGGPAGPTTVLSKRALSMGGVAIAPAPGDKRESVVAWTARDQGVPQVFVTKVGPDGKKIAQKAVTVVARKKREGLPSEPSDVAIAWAGGAGLDDGWIVSWIDTRDGNAEVYAARIDRDLKKVVPDRRITQSPGDAGEVQIAVRGNQTYLAFADARGTAGQDEADPYVVRIDTRTLAKIGEETRVFASAPHSRTPVLSATPGGALMAWIEESPTEGGNPKGKKSGTAEEAGLRVAQIDDKGAVVGAPTLVRGERGGPITSAALACPFADGKPASGKCRAVVTTAVGESLVMSGFELTGTTPAAPLRALATLTGGVTQDVAPSFAGPDAKNLFFADDAVGGAGRVRWMTLSWAPR